MQGHTNRQTINQRKPLTDGMRRMLAELAKGPVAEVDLGQVQKNRMRALCDRRFAAWVIEGRAFVITDAGRAEHTANQHCEER